MSSIQSNNSHTVQEQAPELSLPSISNEELFKNAIAGSDLERAIYFQRRTFSYTNDIPGWMQVELEEIARGYFEKVARTQAVEVNEEFIYFLQFKIRENALLLDPVRRAIGIPDSKKISSLVRKLYDKKASQIGHHPLTPFTVERFGELGLSDATHLADMTKLPVVERGSNSSIRQAIANALKTHDRSNKGKNSKTSTKKELESEERNLFHKCLEFNPQNETLMGSAARSALQELNKKIVAHVILSDFLASKNVTLHSKKLQMLRSELEGDNPFGQLFESDRIATLAVFAEYFDERSEPFLYVSREEALEVHAFSDRNVEILEELEAKRRTESERHGRLKQATQTFESASKEASTRQDLQSIMDEYFSKHENHKFDLEQSRRIINLCLKKQATPEDLRLTLNTTRGNLNQVVLQLRTFGQSNKRTEQRDSEKESAQSPVPSRIIPIEKHSTNILVFAGQGRKDFIAWFEKLEKVDQERLITQVNKLREGYSGSVRPILMRAAEMEYHDVRLWEIRDMHRGLRIYFRYRSSDEIILLVGGNKDTQQNDIKVALQRGANSIQADKLSASQSHSQNITFDQLITATAS